MVVTDEIAGLHLGTGSAATWARSSRDVAPREIVVDAGELLDACLDPDGPHPVTRVTSVRISPSAAAIQRPDEGWPAQLGDRLAGGHVHVAGGVDLVGDQPIAFDPGALDAAVELADRTGSSAFSVSAVGSLLDPSVEFRAAEHLIRYGGGRPVVLSHEAGGLRFHARERAALLNAGLLTPGARILDRATAHARTGGPHARLTFVAADGSKVGSEDARVWPWRLVGSTWPALAQGAGPEEHTGSALVVASTTAGVHVMSFHNGVLRTAPTRAVIENSRSLLLNQRCAARYLVPHDRVDNRLSTRELGDTRPVVLLDAQPGAPEPEILRRLADRLTARFASVTVAEPPRAELAAIGAARARPQAEVMRLGVAGRGHDVAALRRSALSVAQSRVLAVDPDCVARTFADAASPLSYVQTGPVLIRAHVAGFADGDMGDGNER